MECGRVSLPAGQTLSLVLESTSPGKELDDKIEGVELVPTGR